MEYFYKSAGKLKSFVENIKGRHILLNITCQALRIKSRSGRQLEGSYCHLQIKRITE